MNRALVLTTLFLSCGVPSSPPAQEPEAPPVDVVADAGQPSPVDAGVHTGFPCDVHAVLENKCAGCHASNTYAWHFDSRDDFLVVKDGEQLGAIAVQRMNATQRPMPPDGALPAAEREIISNWVNAGMPAGECADLSK